MQSGENKNNNVLRLTKVDLLTRPDHNFLKENDECYFLFEYTPKAGFGYSIGNQLISNLKKSPKKRGKPEYHFKSVAIAQCGSFLSLTLTPDVIKSATFVPVPCSKSIDDDEYDDRMELVCRAIGPEVDVRNIVFQQQSTIASHSAPDGGRLTIQQLEKNYRIDETKCTPRPKSIIIIDDMLTTGAHFKAMQHVLDEYFWGTVPIKGIFIARRKLPDRAAYIMREFNKP